MKTEKWTKRKIKDSVFTSLFSVPEFALELYQTLHPDDQDVSVDEIEIVTLKNILSNNFYNDLGLLVKDEILIFVEAQTTWSINIFPRILLYAARTLKEYIYEHELYLHSAEALKLPHLKFYVVYTGKPVREIRDKPKNLSLKRDYYHGDKGDLEIQLNMVYNTNQGTILDQYCRFAEICDEIIKTHGRTRKSGEVIIQKCLAEGILTEFIKGREKEVMDMVDILFDQEYIYEMGIKEAIKKGRAEGEARGRAEGEARGRAEGEARGKAEGKAEMAISLYSDGMPLDKIVELAGVDPETVKFWLKDIKSDS